jgi:ataxia telangiectasia mutated family protein
MIQTELVDRITILESIGSMLSSISISGPSIFADSSAALFQTVMVQIQREGTSSNGERVEQILTWLFRTWAPSNFHDRMFASQHTTTEPVDVINLINVCLGLPAEQEPPQSLPIWGSVAQSWIMYDQNRDLLDFLLLRNKTTAVEPQLERVEQVPERISSMNHAAVTLLLGLCTAETSSAVDKWQNAKDQNVGHLDGHMIRMVGVLVIVGLCLSNCLRAKDTHRAEQLRAANEKLMVLMFRDLSNPVCEQDKVDALIDLVADRLLVCHPDISTYEGHDHHVCMAKLSTPLLEVFERRRDMTQSESSIKKNDTSDMSDVMDFDADFESQVTSYTAPVSEIRPPRKAIPTNYSIVAQRASVIIYAKLMQSFDSPNGDTIEDPTKELIPRVLELPASEILASGPFLTALPRYGVHLTPKQFEPLLEFFADNTLQSYEYERVETNIDLLLGVMESFVYTWTDASDQEFYTFGLDLYKWFIVTALKAHLLSPRVQKRLVHLMLQILQIDADYGQADKLPTLRSMLFRLMREGTLEVKYFIAHHLSSIFNIFALPVHIEVFEELRISLPTETEWTEGLAVRVLVLANLAADWHSLRRECIYHIFETAGMVTSVEKYAATCVATISNSLSLKSSKELFQLFSPQLLYTWLESQAVAKIPFKVFGYAAMNELLEHNVDEIYAQLVVREKEEEIGWLTSTLNLAEGQILRSTFSKTLAYAISWDVSGKQISSQDPSQVATTCESRIRTFFKTNSEYSVAVQSNLPDIVAQIFTSMYHEEVVEKFLEKRPQYAYAQEALSAMKRYGSLDTELSQAQQPSFKSRYLIDQLERVCRRTGNKTLTTVKDVLDVPHITITLRSIIDCMHPAYGPLHACRTVRKMRIFIALAGDEVFGGYPLQTLIRTLQPVIIDPHCSDDGMGVLQYLLERGKSFLKQELSMITGTGLLILLSLKQFMTSRQDKTTQESQFRNTVSRMQSFHNWLVEYLLEFRSTLKTPQHQAAFCSLVQSCRDLELPGSSSTNQAASALLRGLLDDEDSVSPILGSTERRQVISTLCRNFHVSSKTVHDMFGSDELSLSYARRVWESTQTLTVADDYGAWAAKVLGRAYASTVSLEQIRPTRGLISHLTSGTGEKAHSMQAIVTKLNSLLSSQNRAHVGVAEQSLRSIANQFVALGDHNGAIEFEKVLPGHVIDAIARVYSKDTADVKDSQKLRREELWHAAKLNLESPFELWVQNLAVSICRWAKDDPLVGQLGKLLLSDDKFSPELFPYIVHLALNSEIEKERVVRSYLSEIFNAHFSNHEADTDRKSRLLLESLLYLLTQKIHNEKTRMDRLEWLELDYLLAAEVADKCNMPTASLYLGELGATPQVAAQSSRRSSITLPTPKLPSNELLLSIYSRVDDPDSFYGVKQPPSLESVLARVHHEGDGIKGLMLHSARMDASMRKCGLADESDSFGLIGSVGAMNLSSLTHDLLNRKGGQSTAATTDTMLNAARKLEQWDVSPPQTNGSAVSTVYSVFRGLAGATHLDSVQLDLNKAMSLSIQHLQDTRLDVSAVRATLSSIAVLNEIDELTAVRCSADLSDLWHRMQTRQNGWDIGR